MQAWQERCSYTSNMVSSKRIIWIDYVRVLAILFVVLCHSTEYVYHFDVDSVLARSFPSQVISFLYFTLGRIGVPLFLCMTGYLMLDRKYDKQSCKTFYKSKWLRLLITTEIWVLIFIAYRVIVDGYDLNPSWIIENILLLNPFSLMPHIWYLPVILALYVVIPLIANILRRPNGYRFALVLLVVLILFYYVLPVINTFCSALGIESIISQIQIKFLIIAHGCYLVLGYLCKRGLFDKVPTFVLVIICCIGMGATVGEQLFVYHQDTAYNLWYNNIFLLLTALSLFILISRISFKPRHFIEVIARYSFGVYLIHYLLLYGVTYLASTMQIIMPSSVAVIALTLSVGFLSLVACILINKIPKLDKVLLYMR